jgi:hypothetical protein
MPPHPVAAIPLVRRGWLWEPQRPAVGGREVERCGDRSGALHEPSQKVERCPGWQQNWQRDGSGSVGDQREPVALDRR